jgi:spore germination protein
MFVHVVKPGESLFSIAKRYGGTTERIRAANELEEDRLIPGMSLLIPAGPRSTLRSYTIQEGETIRQIASHVGVPPHIITAVNDRLNEENLEPGTTIWVPSPLRSTRTIDINAFLIPTGGEADSEILKDTADCLTFVSLFNYRVRPDGALSGIPDERALAKCIEEKVAPLLTVTNFDDTRFNPDLARSVIANPTLRLRLITNLVETALKKGYRGINVDFEHLHPEDRNVYNRFISQLAERSRSFSIPVTVTLGPKMADDPKNPLMGAFDYRILGDLADQVILMTFEWGWVGGPPMAIAPLNMVRQVLEYAAEVIPPDKIMMGMALYGYNWPTPYQEGNRAAGISPKAAVEQAIRSQGHIHFHQEFAAPMYTYRGPRQELRQVWFEDGRSMLAKFHLVDEMGLKGISYWMLGNPFPQNWSLVSSTFAIRKYE